jgi:hypothetical protein
VRRRLRREELERSQANLTVDEGRVHGNPSHVATIE